MTTIRSFVFSIDKFKNEGDRVHNELFTKNVTEKIEI